MDHQNFGLQSTLSSRHVNSFGTLLGNKYKNVKMNRFVLTALLLCCNYYVIAFHFSKTMRTIPSRNNFRKLFQSQETDFEMISSSNPPMKPMEAANNNKNRTKKKIIAPVFEDSCESTGITLTRYLIEAVAANPHLVELESLVVSIQTACKTIASVIERASITGVTGLENGGKTINVQGEEQKKLDVITNDILKKALRFSGKVAVLASEEEPAPVSVDQKIGDKYANIGLRTTQFKNDVILDETSSGRFIAVFDPLDGSSNVDAGIPTGTIFGVFEQDDNELCILEDDDGNALSECMVDTLRPGNNLVAAGYCLYSSSVFFCFSLGCGLNIFTLDRMIGEFVLTHSNVQIPKRGKIYSFNEANRHEWDQPLLEYLEKIQKGEGESGQAYSSRYIGSMVGDVHRTLLYGGIFGYPITKKSPDGKLRLLYEAAPMSFLMEQAGGMSLTGKTRIMDLKPKNVHQRVPIVMGSPDDVMEVKKHYDASTDPELAARCKKRAMW